MSTLHPWTPWHFGSGQIRVVGAVGEMEGGLLISLAPVWGFAGWPFPSTPGPVGWHSLCPTLSGSGDRSSHLLCQGSWGQHPSLAWWGEGQGAEEGMGYPLLVSWPLSSLKELFY